MDDSEFYTKIEKIKISCDLFHFRPINTKRNSK